MKVLVIEDEQLAAERLAKIIHQVDENIEVIDYFDTIRDSVKFLNTKQSDIDLLFCDIHLADGSSFEIFTQVEVTKPVIFTTAYDEYSIKAFEVNSVDYLLKPIKAKEVEQSLKKYEKYHGNNGTLDISTIEKLLDKKGSAKRFLVKNGIKLIPKKMGEMAVFYIENKMVHFIDFTEGKKFIIDFTLDELMDKELDPSLFFRINRKQIINIESIETIRPHFGQRLSLTLNVPANHLELIVSREKVNEFKRWFTR